MKNKKIFRLLTMLLAVVLCTAAFSTVAFAGGGDGEPYYTGDSTESAEPEPTPEPKDATGGYDPKPLTPDGNLSLVDDIDAEASGNKQFITVVTKTGNYFYLVIDRAEDGENTVHFLNQVDEADLMALMEDGEPEKPAVCACAEKCAAGAVNTTCPVCASNMSECAGKEAVTELEPEPEPEKKGSGGLMIVLVLLVLGGSGAFAYIKFFKPKQGAKVSSDPDDYDFPDEEYENQDIPEGEEPAETEDED